MKSASWIPPFFTVHISHAARNEGETSLAANPIFGSIYSHNPYTLHCSEPHQNIQQTEIWESHAVLVFLLS
jgi:hypothetical protein